MRILHVIQELRTGGAERILVSLCRGAREAGHEVRVAAAPGVLAGELDSELLPMPIVDRRVSRIPSAVRAARRAIGDVRPDVVHAHNPVMGLAAGIATYRGRRPSGLVSVHGVPEHDWPPAARLVRLSGLPSVACGPEVAEALERHGVEPLAMIPNAVGPAPPPADRAALDREWGLEPETRLVLAVGRLVEQKNHALAIHALAEVPNAKLAIAGDGPLRAELEHVAAEAGVSDRVAFAGLRPDARALMGAADAIVLPSHWEGLPLVALEALASGTPLVATEVRGLRELVTDGREALLVPPDDSHGLGGALRRVLDDPELAAGLTAQAGQVEGAGSEAEMVERFLALYERLAGP